MIEKVLVFSLQQLDACIWKRKQKKGCAGVMVYFCVQVQEIHRIVIYVLCLDQNSLTLVWWISLLVVWACSYYARNMHLDVEWVHERYNKP
jgi:hypothetical protein